MARAQVYQYSCAGAQEACQLYFHTQKVFVRALLPGWHQAVAVGKSIYIIHHRSTQDISVLDVSDPTHPRLSKPRPSRIGSLTIKLAVTCEVPHALQETIVSSCSRVHQGKVP
eukprot:scaffold255937_cov17-Tisochrysis_lutea.AAC.1